MGFLAKPSVNSRVYSGAIFYNQNELTSQSGNYNLKDSESSKASYYNNNKTVDSNYSNSPNANSRLYSGAFYPEQNNITGKKGLTKYNESGFKNQNNPRVNSKLYSGSLFNESN